MPIEPEMGECLMFLEVDEFFVHGSCEVASRSNGSEEGNFCNKDKDELNHVCGFCACS